MTETQEKILAALLEKIRREFPDAVDAVGIYGSVCTGDTHAKSDLDLLILINDKKAYSLARTFILDDEKIAYDIYCTSYQMLESDAQCNHAHLGKLMDSRIVYARDAAASRRIEKLREQARAILSSGMRLKKAGECTERLCRQYAHAMTAGPLGKQRSFAASIIALALDSVMLFNGRYFKKGIKRTFEELDGLKQPKDFCRNIVRIVSSKDEEGLKQALTDFVREHIAFMDFARKASCGKDKKPPAKETIGGTYEEMFSNWKNKMGDAAERNDVFSSFMNLAAFQSMFEEIYSGVDIPYSNIMEKFKPENLRENAESFDDALERYAQEYKKIGLPVTCYADADDFAAVYLGR